MDEVDGDRKVIVSPLLVDWKSQQRL